jgi:S1-C subfamily serine protease
MPTSGNARNIESSPTRRRAASAYTIVSEPTRWAFPARLQPTQDEVAFDLGKTLDAVVALRAEIPDDAFTAPILGTERVGNGVVIGDDGLVLTIGYLVTEARSIWLTANNGSVVPAHPLAFDFATGFGLVVPLGRVRWPKLARGALASVAVDDDVCVIGHGGRAHALKATVFAKREFAGYWEYLLDEALFTTPPHPEWSGAALVGEDGALLGIGSLLVKEASGDEQVDGNMFVPVELLEPILADLMTTGRSRQPPRPWLGVYAAEDEGRLTVNALAPTGPAERAGVRPGDTIVAVGDERIADLADLLRKVWRLGPAGTEIALLLARNGTPVRVRIRSADRGDFLKKPSLQ